MNRVPHTETADSRWNLVYKLSGVAALMVGVLLLIAVVDLILTRLQPGAIDGRLSLFQNNWLVVIFKLHAGFKDVQPNQLYTSSLLDIAILALVGMMYIGLYVALRRTSKIGSILALAQPFLGIVIFVATKSAGRSGLMGAGLVISIVMLRSKLFDKLTAYMGMLSSLLLLAGDISVGIAHSSILAILTGIGYILLTVWLFLIAQRLFQLGQAVSLEGAN